MSYYGSGGGGGGGGTPSKGRDGPGPDNKDDAEQKAAERNLIRRCIDYHNPAVVDLSSRLYRKSCRSGHVRNYPYLQPHSAYLRQMGMPISEVSFPTVCQNFTTYMAHIARAKNSTPVHCLSWTPGGRRLLTGNYEGEFTLWDGHTFSFELIMSAHDTSFRAMTWSHNKNYLLTSDAGGNIKYWSPSIAPVQSIDSHNGQPIHSLSFSPTDTKFVSAGDDSLIRVWDWATHKEEFTLEGHGWDVKSAEWHPRSSLVASGSKDNLVKLWDPRTGGNCLSTFYGHKNTVTQVKWNDNGNWLCTASRDQLIKLYDIRSMKELVSLKGHNKEVTSLAWHPIEESVLASGGMDGSLLFWNLGPKGSPEPVKVPFAHDMAIWDLGWHPAGHMLATVSSDRQTKFWARNRLGSTAGLLSSGGGGASGGDDDEQVVQAEIELGNHVGIVIGRKGATIIGMQRSTGTKMHVDQDRRVLHIQGTTKQIKSVKQRVGALLQRVQMQQSSEDTNRY